MKKKFITGIIGGFVAGAAAMVGLGRFVKKKDEELLRSFNDCDDEEVSELSFDEDLDEEFDLDELYRKEADEALIEDIIDHIIEHIDELTDSQVKTLQKALELRNINLFVEKRKDLKK